MEQIVYFDNAATTPLLPEVRDYMLKLVDDNWGNSSSAHQIGRNAEKELFEACKKVASIFDVPPSHVVFTSGGTESNNLAIWGSLGGLCEGFQWIQSRTDAKVLTSTIEHSATAEVFKCLEKMGANVGWIGVGSDGLLNLTQLEKTLSQSRVRMLSLHHAQNEIGVLQDLATVSKLVREKNPDALIHADTIQSFGKVPINLTTLGVDLISISGHKIGGPKGIGALILGKRFEKRSPKIGRLLYGSSQQNGLRPGTVPLPLIGGLVAAMEWQMSHFTENRAHLLNLRNYLCSRLPKKAVLNGPEDLSSESTVRVPQTVNFSIPGLPAAVIVEALSFRGFCVSSGSACHSTNPKPNHTLTQMGAPQERASTAIRVSFSAKNTTSEIDRFVVCLDEIIEQFSH